MTDSGNQKQAKQGNWFQKHPVLSIVFGLIAFSFVVSAFNGGNKDGTNKMVEVSSNEEMSQVKEDFTNENNFEPEKTATLPVIDPSKYIGKEALIVYKELEESGYVIEISYKKADGVNEAHLEALNRQLATFKSLDPNKQEDRLSVDAFKIDSIVQSGDTLQLVVK